MRVYICDANSKYAVQYIDANAKCGTTLFEEDNKIFAEVLKDGKVWKAEDAILKTQGSGLYVFDGPNSVRKVN